VSAAQTLAAQRQLLDRLVLAGLLPKDRYLAQRVLIADAPRVCCAYHAGVAALVYGPDEQTPLCGPCGVEAYQVVQGRQRTV
jgi:hypothetical protein